jgi:hypothetical protein
MFLKIRNLKRDLTKMFKKKALKSIRKKMKLNKNQKKFLKMLIILKKKVKIYLRSLKLKKINNNN